MTENFLSLGRDVDTQENLISPQTDSTQRTSLRHIIINIKLSKIRENFESRKEKKLITYNGAPCGKYRVISLVRFFESN